MQCCTATGVLPTPPTTPGFPRWWMPYRRMCCITGMPPPEQATLPCPTAAPRPAKTSGALPCPILCRWTAAPTLAADNYEYTLNLSAAQLQQLLAERLGIAADLSPQAQWFGTPVLTSSGYVDSLPVCGQTVQGTPCARHWGCAAPALRWSARAEPSPLPQGATATA